MLKNIILIYLIITTATFASAETDDKSLISVTGEAKMFAAPDEVAISMTVEINDKNLSEAQKHNDDITNKIIKLATNTLNIDEKYVQTNFVNVSPVYQYNMCGKSRCMQPELTHFSTKKGIVIRLKDASILQKLLEKSIEAGVTRIDSVIFNSSKEEILKKQAYAEAARNAQQNATNIASALSVGVGKPHKINVQYSRLATQHSGGVILARMENDSKNSTIALGQITIYAKVSVDFEIDK